MVPNYNWAGRFLVPRFLEGTTLWISVVWIGSCNHEKPSGLLYSITYTSQEHKHACPQTLYYLSSIHIRGSDGIPVVDVELNDFFGCQFNIR